MMMSVHTLANTIGVFSAETSSGSPGTWDNVRNIQKSENGKMLNFHVGKRVICDIVMVLRKH